MTHAPLSKHRAQLAASVALLGSIADRLPVAWQLLQDAQPGYPAGGGGGSGGKGTVSDRTGNLATTERPDVARRDLDDLDRLLQRLAVVVVDCADIVRRWQPPSAAWREALSTEAAASFRDTDCRSCLRAGVHSPRREEGGDLCRWCADWKRELGRAGDLPVWFVELHAQGRRITEVHVARAKQEMRSKR